MNTAISIEHLHKSYGSNAVLNDLSFEVKQGESFALLGTNGAGKTTALSCIEGILPYESGRIRVHGTLGVQLQSSLLPETIKSCEALTLFSKWNPPTLEIEIRQRLGYDQIRDKPYKSLSTGQKRRLHLMLALVGNPDILILDEPSAGLDVEGRYAMHEEIRALKRQGKTIVLASHDLAEVESLCDRIAILKDGRIAFLGTPDEATQQLSSIYRVQVKTSKALQLDALQLCSFQGQQEQYSMFEVENIADGLLELLHTAKAQGAHIEDVKVEHQTLEQRFMDIAKERTS